MKKIDIYIMLLWATLILAMFWWVKLTSPTIIVNTYPQYIIHEHKTEQITQNIKMDYQISIHKATVTGYHAPAGGTNCAGDCNTTAIGFKISAILNNQELTYCAVDPNTIPLGSIIIVQGLSKPCIAVDTGGAIKGYHIDYHFDTYQEAIRWGRQTKTIVILKRRDNHEESTN